MSHPATTAREAAVHFEAKKTGFGQAQDGWSITLRIQDEDVPPHVRDAKKGTRFMVALVEIGDDEKPVVREHFPPRSSVQSVTALASGAKEKKRFDEMAPAQQAGILCNELAFRVYLNERPDVEFPCSTPEEAAFIVRELCEVNSRADITPTNVKWSSLVLAYRIWQREPEFIGA